MPLPALPQAPLQPLPVRYAGQAALTIPAGQWLALLGRNDTGKRTAIGLPARCYRADAGDVHWLGGDRQLHQPCKRPGVMLQGTTLRPVLWRRRRRQAAAVPRLCVGPAELA